MRRVPLLLAAICCVIGAHSVRPAEARRVALVIGNAEYKIGPLQNPMNDAAAVAEVFDKQLKFDKVILRRNVGAEAFRTALRELSREVSGAELGVVYFAGHGTEVGGKNYLIPVDAALDRASALELETISLDTVLAQLEGARRLKLVILDACRNNIFGLGGAKRSLSRGLARIEPESNTLVAFAAREGTTADDGKDRHSPYTAALLKHIATPGLEINLLFRRVRSDVLAATGGAQQPAEYHSLGEKEIFLVPPLPLPVVAAPVVPAPAPPSEAARTWAAMKDTTSIAVLEEFRRRHGAANPVYERLAEARIAELRKQQVALAKGDENTKDYKVPYKVVGPLPQRATDLPQILLGPGNVVPECVSPGRLMAFLKRRNPEVSPRFNSIATEYMRLGELLGVRWDFAFYQMVIETGALSYPGDVRPEQNNFAGLGATGRGERGESFKDIETGVRAHLEQALLYAGHPVANPVAERTRKVQSWGVLAAWQETLKRPITYADLAAKWAPGQRTYGDMLRTLAEQFHGDLCSAPDPSPEGPAPPAPASAPISAPKAAPIPPPKASAPVSPPKASAPAPKASAPVAVPKKASNHAPPNALQYSSRIWPHGSIPFGKTETADTPYGKLSCTNVNSTTRLCSWQ